MSSPAGHCLVQILTGDSTVRQAEDIGGQEIAYAEVKAIASGNPAVLTLAETDATLRRLHLLQKQHTDAQYLARRRQRDLPQDIARLERRLAALTQDMQTAEAQGGVPLTIGTRTYPRAHALVPLTERLRTLPTMLFETRSVPLGMVQGLHFGLVQHPEGTLGVYVEGALKRSTLLARETPGPRAVLNAVDRLLASAAQDRDTTRRDLAIAQGQLRDYTARLGATFAHTAYLEELIDLRHQLAQALSSTAQADATPPPLADLVARLTALHAAHTLDANPQRATSRRRPRLSPRPSVLRKRPRRWCWCPPPLVSPPASARVVLVPHRAKNALRHSSCACGRDAPAVWVDPALWLLSTPGGSGSTLFSPRHHATSRHRPLLYYALQNISTTTTKPPCNFLNYDAAGNTERQKHRMWHDLVPNALAHTTTGQL